jgi:hypothetical protein
MAKRDLLDIAQTLLVGGPLVAWIAMLLLGALYHELHVLQPYGYLPTLAVCMAVALLSIPFELRLRHMDRTGSRF